jgi:hypothetical protein
MLKNLLPAKSTELSELVKISADDNFNTLLPSAMSDEILLSLGRDLKLMGTSRQNVMTDSSKLTIPLYVISKLALRKVTGTKSKINVSFDFAKVDDAFALLEAELEREILQRIFGVGGGSNDQRFLTNLDNCLGI